MMTRDFFEAVLAHRIALINKGLTNKNREYATAENPMHNFDRAAEVLRQSPEKCLVGFWMKHIISILDMVDSNLDMILPTGERIEEKIGDAINYLIILEAMLRQRLNLEGEEKDGAPVKEVSVRQQIVGCASGNKSCQFQSFGSGGVNCTAVLGTCNLQRTFF